MSSSSASDRPGQARDGSARAIDERSIDRKLLALLIARHGAPPRAPKLSPEEEERRLLRARRDRALAAANPELVHHIERHERSSDQLAGTSRSAAHASEQLRARRRPIGVDESVIQVRDIGELRELELAEELYEAMEHRTPQAFLRDLHRPVQHFGGVELRRIPSPTAATALARARALASEAMTGRTTAATSFGLSSQLARAAIQELRVTLARPWGESRPANPLPMPSRSPSADDMRWFGISGGYDPDL